jgi:hypothetical protein
MRPRLRPIAVIAVITLAAGCGGVSTDDWWARNDPRAIRDPERSVLLNEYPWMVESAPHARTTGQAWLRPPPD